MNFQKMKNGSLPLSSWTQSPPPTLKCKMELYWEAQSRADQSFVKTSRPDLKAYAWAEEMEQGGCFKNHWPSNQSQVTHLESLEGRPGIPTDII